MKNLPVAVQVYSVRDDAERDFKGTMQKLKEMGYDGVELAGLYGMKPAEVKGERRRYCGRICCLSRRRVLTLPQCF